MKQSTQYERDYHRKASLVGLIILVCHLPIMAYAGYHYDTGLRFGALVSLAILSGPAALWFLRPSSVLMAASIGAASMCFSALLIHLSRGFIEMHFTSSWRSPAWWVWRA